MLCCVGEQCHIACLLDGTTQATLMLGAGARLTARFDLATIRDVALHEAASIFVIDLTDMIVTELTNFASRGTLTTPTFTAGAVGDPDGDGVQYQFQVATGPDAQSGRELTSL